MMRLRKITAILFISCVLSPSSNADTVSIPSLQSNAIIETETPAVISAEKGIFKILLEDGKSVDAHLGRGFNSLSGDFKGDCVIAKVTPNHTSAFDVDYSLMQIKSSEEFRRMLQMSASASMGVGIWKGDASASFFKSLDRNRYYDYLLVNVSVLGPSYSINDGNLSDVAKKLRKRARDFYTRCGNQYVKAVVLGGVFSAIITIETDNETERSELRTALSIAAAGYGSAKASFAESLSRVTKNYKRTVRILRKGTSEALPDLSIDGLIQYSTDFPAKINEKTAYPVSFEKAYYTDIDPNLPSYQSEEILADDWATRAGDLYADYADLIFYRDNKNNKSNFYPPLSDEQINSGVAKLSSMVSNIKLQYISCLEDPIVACKKMIFPALDVTLPRRAQRSGINEKLGSAQFVGVVGKEESKTIAVLGEWSAWDNGENTWWPPERCCFSVVISPENSPTVEKPYVGPVKIEGPARVSIRIDDNPHADNRSRDLVGVLY